MTKKEQGRQDRLMVLEAKITVYNALVPEIKGWAVKYWGALKEIWQKPIPIRCGGDEDILIKHGLGYRYGGDFVWDLGLKGLNNRLRLKA